MTDESLELLDKLLDGDDVDALAEFLEAHPGILLQIDDSFPAPLAYAIGNHNVEMVKLVLRHGAALDYEVSAFSDPPLHLAALISEPEIVRLLLEAGVPVDQEIGGRTPLWSACRGEDSRYIEVVRILLEHGADPNEIWPEGFSPLVYAHDLCKDKLEQVLLEFGAVQRVGNPELLEGHLSPVEAFAALAMREPPGIPWEELGPKVLDAIGHGDIDWDKIVFTKDGKPYAILSRKLPFRESILRAREQLERMSDGDADIPAPPPPELPWEELGPVVLAATSQGGEKWGGLDIDKNGQRYARLAQIPPYASDVQRGWEDVENMASDEVRRAREALEGSDDDPPLHECL